MKDKRTLGAIWGVIKYLDDAEECHHYGECRLDGPCRDHVFLKARKLAEYLTTFPNPYREAAQDCLVRWDDQLWEMRCEQSELEQQPASSTT
jgi:hypothetical protein